MMTEPTCCGMRLVPSRCRFLFYHSIFKADMFFKESASNRYCDRARRFATPLFHFSLSFFPPFSGWWARYVNGAGNSWDDVRAGSRRGREEKARTPGRSGGYGVVEATEGGAATSKASWTTWGMCHKWAFSDLATLLPFMSLALEATVS